MNELLKFKENSEKILKHFENLPEMREFTAFSKFVVF